MEIKCFAKINWALSVLGKRKDGYHELDMIMQSVDLADKISLLESDRDSLIVNGQAIVDAENNLCIKASRAFRKHHSSDKKYTIELTKIIPIGAGMGGGSADAAGVLFALNFLHGKPFTLEELQTIGKSLGADIPFMLHGACARVQGIGEKLQALSIPKQKLLIIFDDLFVSTKDVFENHTIGSSNIDMDYVLKALQENNLGSLHRKCLNHLEISAIKFQPKISEIIQNLYDKGASFASMTGSGSAVFAVFPNEEILREAYEDCQAFYKRCYLCDTLNYGLQLIQ